MRRFTLRRASAVVGMGSQARRALIELGGDGIPIFDAPNAADVGRLEARLGTVENIDAVKSIRQTHAVNGKLAIIVGRLIPMKGIEILLDAWRAVPPAARREWSLVFVGDGPLRELIETQRDLGAAVVGHVPPAQLADWYAAADLHVFPSLGDPWGLVVNEAMTCGVPTLCSDLAGCRDDMIRHDVTGFRFDPSASAASVAAAIEHALTHPDLATIGKQGRVHAARFAPARMAKGIAIAVEYACRKANRKEVMA
jgi:glycosyltransferase involved in cell wall biosynthesis